MTTVLILLAVVAALRGTWSPCGLSVLSTITPVAERARGTSFARSAIWYVLGATVGGAALGAFAAVVGEAVGLFDPATSLRALLTFALIATCVAADARVGGFHLPERPRQVDATWVQRFRPWVYAGGFGVQVGAGLLTYVMTNAVYAVVVAGALLVSPPVAVALGVLFGATRGLTVLLGAWASSPSRLRRLHAGLERHRTASLASAMAAQLAVLVVLAVAAPPPAAAPLGAAIALLLCACARRVRVHPPVPVPS